MCNRHHSLIRVLLDIIPYRDIERAMSRFAKDSDSKLGKIRHARQGQFSINNRDSNTPYIKKVRVVSTVEYYLSD
jgi:hypothetical protein